METDHGSVVADLRKLVPVAEGPSTHRLTGFL
ncbi:hypothetical protein SAMN05444171_0453 [Bradyrhizobium lablabi]|uniref:Uncharacterized protein n=2 Tax=Bradyrhizobium TaxID=374 RepID=A0ABY0QCB4_9BRAD|nr:hypothetical protein SAMN05444163_6704 [Bradyrhizobium ottawaense]SEC01435.1 hypothetical protein SAMN05444171_0453 [Bradyrhizobium lablabi]SHM68333.1 hypothetical protein SAMN05444321_7232 [Bradyrhizobium lablabi]